MFPVHHNIINPLAVSTLLLLQNNMMFLLEYVKNVVIICDKYYIISIHQQIV